jgi:hypothetical protein
VSSEAGFLEKLSAGSCWIGLIALVFGAGPQQSPSLAVAGFAGALLLVGGFVVWVFARLARFTKKQ